MACSNMAFGFGRSVVRLHPDRAWCFLERDDHEHFSFPSLDRDPVSRQHRLQEVGAAGGSQRQRAGLGGAQIGRLACASAQVGFPGMGKAGDRAPVFLMAGVQKQILRPARLGVCVTPTRAN